MSNLIGTIFRPVFDFLAHPIKRCLLLIGILIIVAAVDFFLLGVARKTFVFYTIKEGTISVEDRMLKHTSSREDDIIRYAEETLLGPVSPDLLPLFPRGTGLVSLMYRDGVVYADLTEDAAFPPKEGGSTLNNFRTFHASILSNFSYVKDVQFFIEGNAVFAEEFQ